MQKDSVHLAKPVETSTDPSFALAEIQRLLKIMLASATTLGGEWIEGYQIKTGALHNILGVMQAAGFPVSIPLPQPDISEFRKAMQEEVIPAIVEAMRKRAEAGAEISHLPLNMPAASNLGLAD